MIKLNALHKKRLMILVVILIIASSVVSLVLYGLKNSINLFLTPSELLQSSNAQHATMHVGGMVKEGSIVRSSDRLNVKFEVTDFTKTVPVEYNGILPDLFREGKGVVMRGTLDQNGVFQADEILAKHDEKYEPMVMQKKVK